MKDVSMFKLGFLFTLGSMCAGVIVTIALVIVIMMFAPHGGY